jgi:hypothetical protein
MVGLTPALRVSTRTSANLIVDHQGHHGAVVAGARGATRAVQVGLVLDRRIGVHHQADIVDVDAAGRDGRWRPAPRPSVGERAEVAGAGVLGQVAVQFGLPARHANSACAQGLWRRTWCGRRRWCGRGRPPRSASTSKRAAPSTCSTRVHHGPRPGTARSPRCARSGRAVAVDQDVDAVVQVAENSSRWQLRGVRSSSRFTGGAGSTRSPCGRPRRAR